LENRMHSLKNTIVAVGLLGLSFVFYQLSDPKNLPEGSEDLVAAELDAMVSDGAQPIEMPDLGVSDLESESDLSPAQLPPPASTNRNSSAALPAPKQPSSFLASPKPGVTNAPVTAQPRPDAEFNFTQSPKPIGQNTKPLGSGGGFEPAVAEQQKRDQGLMTALDQQKESSSGGNAFAVKAALPSNQQPAPVKPASTIRDSAVVGVSSHDAGGDLGNDFGIPAVKRDPYAALSFREAWPVVDKLVAEEDFRSVLKLLTRFYHDSTLSGPQRQRLLAWLDALATKVVFSAEHHLHPVYSTRQGDSLASLQASWGVPSQLIYNVNKEDISNPASLAPGTELKKIQGPFSAVVDVHSGTTTAYVDGLYAGRYPTSIGISGNPRRGDFKVMFKNEKGHEWQDQTGAYPPGHPKNQYGSYWIGLEGRLCIHAISTDRQPGHQGCLGLPEQQAKELFSMLSPGSIVTIK
jgi:hypothetical protein